MKKLFLAKNDKRYTIILDDSGELITVMQGTETLGELTLRYIEGYYPKQSDCYHITGLHYEKCKGLGIGEASLCFHQEVFESMITASTPYDTQKRDDGSHLIEDGVGFILNMQDKGIVTGG